MWLLFFTAAGLLTAASKVANAAWGSGVSGIEFSVISGHTMLSSAVYPLVLLLCTEGLGGRWPRRAALVGFAFGALIGWSRVKYGAHTDADSLAGWLIGSAASAFVAQVLSQ